MRPPGVQCKAGEACGLPADAVGADENRVLDRGCCGPAQATSAELISLE